MVVVGTPDAGASNGGPGVGCSYVLGPAGLVVEGFEVEVGAEEGGEGWVGFGFDGVVFADEDWIVPGLVDSKRLIHNSPHAG
jgi:hypothetical protein